jgi:methionine biosynthesis protein MetW
VLETATSTQHPKYDLDGLFDPARTNPNDAHSILMRLVPPKTRVLELGCSSGYLSGYLVREKNCYVTGFELDPAATRIAATRCQEVYTADLDNVASLEVAKGPYDVLLAPAVLEHLKYPERVLEVVRSKLAPNAIVLVSVPNIAHWSSRLKLLRGSFDYTDYGLMDRTHVHFYTVQTGKALLENNGYRVEALYIGGSLVQNLLNSVARKFGKSIDKPIWPNLLGYELIYVARPMG